MKIAKQMKEMKVLKTNMTELVVVVLVAAVLVELLYLILILTQMHVRVKRLLKLSTDIQTRNVKKFQLFNAPQKTLKVILRLFASKLLKP